MRELTVVELNDVSGAGWLKDAMTTFGTQVGESLWTSGNSALSSVLSSIEIPVIGKIDLMTLAPNLGKTLGQTLGSVLGGAIEDTLSALPNVGQYFKLIFDVK